MTIIVLVGMFYCDSFQVDEFHAAENVVTIVSTNVDEKTPPKAVPAAPSLLPTPAAHVVEEAVEAAPKSAPTTQEKSPTVSLGIDPQCTERRICKSVESLWNLD